MAAIEYNESQVAEQRDYCYAERLKGHTYRDIAVSFEHTFGYPLSYSTVKRRIQEELDSRPAPNVEEVRKQGLDRLDYLQSKLKLDDGDPQAIATALRIEESRRKLLGVDAPVKQDIQVVAIDATNSAIGTLLARQQARNAEIESRLRELEAAPEEVVSQANEIVVEPEDEQ